MLDKAKPKVNAESNAVSWYDELKIPLRIPRPPDNELAALLKDIKEPKIFLRDDARNVEVVVRFPKLSRPFPSQMKAQLTRFGLTLSEAFDAVLWEKLGTTNTVWVELATPAIEAYRQTWLRFFRLVYVGHFHPSANEWLKTVEKKLDSDAKVTHRGRRPQTQAEKASLRRRYNTLLAKCRLIHSAAKSVTASAEKETGSRASNLVRREIWEKVKRDIHGMPGDGYIFGGTAFKRIPYGFASLDDPKSWNPKQLAISLLSFERDQAYQTIEKKVATKRRQNLNRT